MSYQKLIQTYRESDNLVDWLQRFVGTVAEIENWREVGAAGNPDFEGTWVNFDTGAHTKAAFYKDPFNIVHIKGLVKSGTLDTTIFTLPTEYIPTEAYIFAGQETATTSCRLYVNSDGTIVTVGATSVLAQAINISFRV